MANLESISKRFDVLIMPNVAANSNQQGEALASLTEDERIDFEERTAIMEYDGGLSRDEAEKRGLERVLNRRQHGHTE